MDLGKTLISDLIVWDKYAKFMPEKGRRETWSEVVTRTLEMHIKRYPQLKDDILRHGQRILDREILGSMRGHQFAGKPIELTPSRIYNCAYMPLKDRKFFREAMFLLIGGTGLGYSVESKYVKQLPCRKKITRKSRLLIGDSKEGWSHAVDMLFKGDLEQGIEYVFDYRDIREKGTPLKTAGGVAPGYEDLKKALDNCKMVLESLKIGQRLSTLQAHDCVCYIAQAIRAGGIRRAALIVFFDNDDESMLTCKYPEHFMPWGAEQKNAQRALANNSAVIDRFLPKEEQDEIIEKILVACEKSGSGEPGFIITDHQHRGNPCLEISLKPYQFCNLVEGNAAIVKDKQHFLDLCRSLAFFGTLQASYTDFHFLRSEWKEVTESEALLGVSFTGICANRIKDEWWTEGRQVVNDTNKQIAQKLGIRPAARTTCVKPAGTTSLVLGGVPSGCHAGFGSRLIRRVTVSKHTALGIHLKKVLDGRKALHVPLIEECSWDSTSYTVPIPLKFKEGSVTKRDDEVIEDQLNRVKMLMQEWIGAKDSHPDTVDQTHHTVSFTGYVRDEEWDKVRQWVKDNKSYIKGMSFLPYMGGVYKHAPFEEIDESLYTALYKEWESVGFNIADVKESIDNTTLVAELACAGGACEI